MYLSVVVFISFATKVIATGIYQRTKHLILYGNFMHNEDKLLPLRVMEILATLLAFPLKLTCQKNMSSTITKS